MLEHLHTRPPSRLLDLGGHVVTVLPAATVLTCTPQNCPSFTSPFLTNH